MFSAVTPFFSATTHRPASTSSTDASTAVHAHPSREVSCPVQTYPRITSRTLFKPDGCIIYGHSSTGGILVKSKANILDMDSSSLPRIHAVERSYDSAEEDAFCKRLRRVGATWWQYDNQWIHRRYSRYDIPSNLFTLATRILHYSSESRSLSVPPYHYHLDPVGLADRICNLRYSSSMLMHKPCDRMIYCVYMRRTHYKSLLMASLPYHPASVTS
jgi:hemin uptake protein HemP